MSYLSNCSLNSSASKYFNPREFNDVGRTATRFSGLDSPVLADVVKGCDDCVDNTLFCTTDSWEQQQGRMLRRWMERARRRRATI
mmetsp:Transcript_1479/g.2254  ORF Transcript_1479/g.2254 Transcript_1479/m.2254 type:complete len:85 (+) Transcript_1479:772-1026(+)